MADRYDPRVLRTPAAPAVMPPRSDRQGTAPSPADRRPIPRQTSGAHAAPVEITARPGGLRPHPGEARGAVSEPSQFAPPPRGATLFRPKSPLPEPEWQGDELADAVPFGVGATTEEGAYDEETLAPGEPVASPPEIAKRRPRRLNRSIGGGVLAVALAAGVTYMTLPGKSSVAMPPIAVAVTPPKVVPAYKNGQDMPPNQSVDGAETADKTKLVTPGVGDVASDDNAASGDHSAAGVASASDADADQVSTGKPPPDASPAPAAITPAGPAGVPASASGDATPAPPVAPTGRVFVQFSAQKSETAARSTYHGLRTKFPTILGKLDPNIQRADLGDKGVFYRVRVGPFALADAQKICGSYKAVGGSDCLIARH